MSLGQILVSELLNVSIKSWGGKRGEGEGEAEEKEGEGEEDGVSGCKQAGGSP